MIARSTANAACLALALFVHEAVAASDPLYTEAVQEYRAGRWSSAFGRFITLANNGNVEAARIALFMQLHGRQLYSSDWDVSEDDIALWSRMTGARAGAGGARGIQLREQESALARAHDALHHANVFPHICTRRMPCG